MKLFATKANWRKKFKAQANELEQAGTKAQSNAEVR